MFFLSTHFNVSMFLVAGFLFIASSREQNMAIYSFLHSLSTKEKEMKRCGGMRGEQLVVLEETKINDIIRLFTPQRYHLVRVVDRSCRTVGEISETALLEAAVKNGIYIPVKKIL